MEVLTLIDLNLFELFEDLKYLYFEGFDIYIYPEGRVATICSHPWRKKM